MLIGVWVAPLAVVALAGCLEADYAYLINESGVPLHVRYAVRFSDFDPGVQPPICALQHDPPLVRSSADMDYEKHADQGAAFRPQFEYVILESSNARREWRQWDAVAEFKRDWWSGDCFMRIRSPL